MSLRTAVFSADSPRTKLVMAALGMVALLQIAAFYTLCADQVRKAGARDAGVQQQHAAVTQCLHASMQSTIGGCHAQLRRSFNDGSSAMAESLSAAHAGALRGAGVVAMPATFSFR